MENEYRPIIISGDTFGVGRPRWYRIGIWVAWWIAAATAAAAVVFVWPW